MKDKKLIILESPNKIHTVSKIVGPEYTVLATAGHIMKISDTGAYNTGIDTKNSFKMSMIFDSARKELITKIKELSKSANKIFICTDPDREGEVIADEVRTLLKNNKVSDKIIFRATFNEITEKAVKSAIKNPIPFNENMIDAGKCRASLDKLVGYRLSGITLSKLNCESAGRVQSALLKLICEKEEKIQKFVSEKYYEILMDFIKNRKTYTAKLRINKKDRFDDFNFVNKVLEELKNENNEFLIFDIKSKIRKIDPKQPLTTASLQQLSSNINGFSPSKTMTTAQHLFEKGYITYIRTDAVRFSDEFVNECKNYINSDLYKGLTISNKSNENVQNGHESIHQTSLEMTPEKISTLVDSAEYKLYKMIFNYSLASFCKPAEVEDQEITIIEKSSGEKYKFIINGRKINYNGFAKFTEEDLTEGYSDLSCFNRNDVVNVKEIYKKEKQTQPPARYSEAGLVKLMQTTGIGRPSSFSSTIETLKKRDYIEVEKKSVHATEKGIKLNNSLQKYFPNIINEKYTSELEEKLDEIANGDTNRINVLSDFWKDFEPLVLSASRNINKEKPKPDIVDGRICPKCGATLVYREGKFGKFIACSKFPRCKYTETIEDENKEKIQCPDCGDGVMLLRKSKKGQLFYGCSRWPKCTRTFTEEAMKNYLLNLHKEVDNSKDNS